MTQRKAAPKFGVDDTVRFIGADTALTVRQIDQETLEYKVQLGDDAAEVLKQFAIERVQVYTP
jgi:hypothetical protein